MLIFFFYFFTDDFEEIKQDILSFRFEVMNLWKTREALQDEISANIKTILQCINNGSLSNPMKRRVLSENTVISEEESWNSYLRFRSSLLFFDIFSDDAHFVPFVHTC